MFFRDDISSWLFKRVRGASAIKSSKLKPLVVSNTEACISRIRMVCPSHSRGTMAMILGFSPSSEIPQAQHPGMRQSHGACRREHQPAVHVSVCLRPGSKTRAGSGLLPQQCPAFAACGTAPVVTEKAESDAQ